VALAVRADGAGTIGAAGFAVFCHRVGAASVHASYYALLAGFRGLGLGRLMLHAVCRSAIGFIAEARPAALRAGPVVQFIEANDIASMTLGDRLQDQAIALHPLARDALWERLGFREIVDIHYRQRSDPPIGLALKALLIRVDGAGYDLVAPDAVAGALVRRHVRAFDNLLMNYATARTLVARGRKLPAPRPAGLLARVDPRAALATKPPDQAARERSCWAEIDARLSRCAGLPLGATMQALRDAVS
jgi:GNAT superfamily N-acetyltransferase